MFNNSTNEIEIISFAPYYEHTIHKEVFFFICILSNFITIPLIYGIIWFEQNNHLTTLINKIVTSLCWHQICFNVIVYSLSINHYINGPAGNLICSLEVVLQNVAGMQAIFLLDTIVVTKYIFVHLIKNAVAIDEGFFRNFINISTFSFSLISQSIYIWMPGRNPMLYYICVGSFPMTKSPFQDPVKVNFPVLALLALSGCIHIYTGIKKRKANQSVAPKVEFVSENGRTIFNVLTDKDMLANYTSSIVSFLWLSIMVVLVYLFNKTKPQDLSRYPNDFLILFWTMAMPQILSYGTIVIYYSHHESSKNEIITILHKIE